MNRTTPAFNLKSMFPMPINDRNDTSGLKAEVPGIKLKSRYKDQVIRIPKNQISFSKEFNYQAKKQLSESIEFYSSPLPISADQDQTTRQLIAKIQGNRNVRKLENLGVGVR